MGKETIPAPSGPVRTIQLSIRSHSSAGFSEFAPPGGYLHGSEVGREQRGVETAAG